MRERKAPSGSGLFLIELLFGLLIFALTAAVCLQIFVGSHRISNESNRLNHAVVMAQNGAECFKASGGDLRDTAMLIKGHLYSDDVVFKYFDSEWNSVFTILFDEAGKATNAAYVLEIRRLPEQNGHMVIAGEAVVSDVAGHVIFSIPVAALNREAL